MSVLSPSPPATRRLRRLFRIGAVLGRWDADPYSRNSFVLHSRLAPREAALAPLPDDLAPGVSAALAGRGIAALYAHQRVAYEHACAGRHVVVSTPTASGKSLCYNLPVAQSLATEPSARTLQLFPTKALARDQEASLRALLSAAGITAPPVVYAPGPYYYVR